MDIRRIIRGPVVWIGIAVLLVILASSLLGNVGGPKDVDTSQVVSAIQNGDITTATIVDRDQKIEVTLTNGERIRSQYVEGQGVELQNMLQEQVKAGKVKDGYNVEVPHDSVLLSLTIAFLPSWSSSSSCSSS